MEDIELPIGNSHQMQLLRQTMKTLAQDLSPVFFSGQPGEDTRNLGPLSFFPAKSQNRYGPFL